MDNEILKIIQKIRRQVKVKSAKNLPALFFFTDRKKFADIFAVVKNLPKGTAIIIREYDLSREERLEFAKKIVAAARKDSKILVGKDYDLALKIKADGVHFSDFDNPFFSSSSRRKSGSTSRPSALVDPSFRWDDGSRGWDCGTRRMLLTYSCHTTKSIIKAKKLGADLIFYSPIFATVSHPDQKPCGALQLRNITLKTSLLASLPVYALGGINKENIRQLMSCKIAGIGGISMFK